MTRSAVIVPNLLVKMQMENTAKASGIHEYERYFTKDKIDNAMNCREGRMSLVKLAAQQKQEGGIAGWTKTASFNSCWCRFNWRYCCQRCSITCGRTWN